MYRRILCASALLIAFAHAPARADESIAGQWEADLGQGKSISMTILADGHWLSESIENNLKVGQMAGSYKQTRRNDTSGTLVFTPDLSKTHVNRAHGAPRVETDQYTLADNGRTLRLKPKSGSEMDFQKQ